MKPKSIKFVGMTLQEANQHLINQLKKNYDDGEAMHIANLVMEFVSGRTRSERAKQVNEQLTAEGKALIEKYSYELLNNKPVQYILNEAWFADMKFYVDESVLIPRPETEELVKWVVDEVTRSGKNGISILDIGTGSGCIAIALKKKLPGADVHAIDISEKALEVAQKNAQQNNTEVLFRKSDILDQEQWNDLPRFDIVVSNPPYIPEQERTTMHDNVVQFEPRIALFVPDDDPLIFYKAIAHFADPTAKIYFEIHQNMGQQLQDYFLKSEKYYAELKKDMHGNNRFFSIVRLPYQP